MLRHNLGIPEKAIVFGGYGGIHGFNIPFVHEAVISVVKKRNDIFFPFYEF